MFGFARCDDGADIGCLGGRRGCIDESKKGRVRIGLIQIEDISVLVPTLESLCL